MRKKKNLSTFSIYSIFLLGNTLKCHSDSKSDWGCCCSCEGAEVCRWTKNIQKYVGCFHTASYYTLALFSSPKNNNIVCGGRINSSNWLVLFCVLVVSNQTYHIHKVVFFSHFWMLKALHTQVLFRTNLGVCGVQCRNCLWWGPVFLILERPRARRTPALALWSSKIRDFLRCILSYLRLVVAMAPWIRCINSVHNLDQKPFIQFL